MIVKGPLYVEMQCQPSATYYFDTGATRDPFNLQNLNGITVAELSTLWVFKMTRNAI